MIQRPLASKRLIKALNRSSAVALLGPRQSGKTTLCRSLVDPNSVNYFDLEDPVSLARLDEPKLALESLQGLILIDEVQRKPDSQEDFATSCAHSF